MLAQSCVGKERRMTKIRNIALLKNCFDLSSRQHYWDCKYKSRSLLWGSKTEVFDHYLHVFRTEGVRKILVLGCGYGRSSIHFADAGFEVSGLDFSREAIEVGRGFVQGRRSLQLVVANVCNIPFKEDSFEGVFAYNIFHLLLDRERYSFMLEIERVTMKDSVVILITRSNLDRDYGKGVKIEKDTFDIDGRGRPMHFSTNDEMLEHFKGYQVLELRRIKIHEKHEKKQHVHHAMRVVARKTASDSRELEGTSFKGVQDD